ncbi:MAG: hypothetical protein MHM6MM_004457 [Cercozoa sp. M6MM]
MDDTCTIKGVRLHAWIEQDVLRVSAESDIVDTHPHASQFWCGTFSRDYVEQMTKQTGSFKQFDVFASMLRAAMQRWSASQEELTAASLPPVYLDFLTLADLHELRAQKTGASTFSLVNEDENRRFLILTYAAAFDRVHYPLTLHKQSHPPEDVLMRTIAHLRKQLKSRKPSAFEAEQSAKAKQMKRQLREVTEEAGMLRAKLQHAETELCRRQAEKTVVDERRKQQTQEIQSHLQQVEKQLADRNAECELLKERCRSLRAELFSLKSQSHGPRPRGRSPQSPHSRRSSSSRARSPSLSEASEASDYSEASKFSCESSVSSHKSESKRRSRRKRRASSLSNLTRPTAASLQRRSSMAVHARFNRSASRRSQKSVEHRSERPQRRTASRKRFRRFDPTSYVRDQLLRRKARSRSSSRSRSTLEPSSPVSSSRSKSSRSRRSGSRRRNSQSLRGDTPRHSRPRTHRLSSPSPSQSPSPKPRHFFSRRKQNAHADSRTGETMQGVDMRLSRLRRFLDRAREGAIH